MKYVSDLSDTLWGRLPLRRLVGGGTALATKTLPLPFTSAYDPPMEGEGRLDPLGLGQLADRIADSYARPVRARMKRIRFLTAMALGGKIAPELMDVTPAVAGDTPEIAFERVVIESLARAGSGGLQLDTGIPGITKAQAALMGKLRLDARGYLKTPKVFGFSGVYRPLATATHLLDANGGTLPAGESLLEGLNHDARRNSEFESDPSSSEFLEWITQATADGLREGRNTFRKKSPHVQSLAMIAAPQLAGPKERSALSQVLHSPDSAGHVEDEAAYLEVLSLISQAPEELGSEVDWVDYLRARGSEGLRARMNMLITFEDFGRDLLWAFETYRFLSSQSVGGVPAGGVLATDEVLTTVAQTIGNRYRTTLTAMERASDFGVDVDISARFTHSFADFDRPMNSLELLDTLMLHHSEVQRAKPPMGKRPWLQSLNGHWVCRPLFYIKEPVARRETFIHPYRLDTLVRFLADVHE